MFIKSMNDKNTSRVNLDLVQEYYPVDNHGGRIQFVHPDGRTTEWLYDSVEERDAEIAKIDAIVC